MSITLDPHSYANFNDVIVTHYSINLRTDFPNKVFHGYVDVTAKVISDQSSELFLDVKSLVVRRVTDYDNNDDLISWATIESNINGTCLTIYVPHEKRSVGSEFTVRIEYSTTPESESIQWLEPSQTAGKIYPYCYTQCEAILARTLLPCQDTPAVKAPYTITVSCPEPLVAACSGISLNNEPIVETNGYLSYSFNQPNPVPAYLIALVVGKLEQGRIGPRSSVYTEKELLDRAIYEFSEDTENYICACEEITGIKYKWGVYDMVVLPSAFPYGGMENPNLTFLSASLLAGDRSLTNVVAHEIVHSWSGNLITNASWSDFWLNEGFTVYIERMVLGKVAKSVQYRHFEILCGYNDLKKTLVALKDQPEFTKLVPNLDGINPDDAFSKIPYEKGSLFLFYLETLVGGEMSMQRWLNSYFCTFAGKSLNTNDMVKHFCNHFSTIEAIKTIDWNTWLHGAGLPPFDPTTVLDKTLSTNCTDLARSWLDNDGKTATCDGLKGFRSEQVMFFLDEIITGTVDGLHHDALDRMKSLYKLSESPNVEINFRWLQLCLKSKYLDVIPQAADFLSKHGRGLYVKPLYKALNGVDHKVAVEIYNKNRPYYHSVIRSVFDKDLEYNEN